jgi:hypothetical protein
MVKHGIWDPICLHHVSVLCHNVLPTIQCSNLLPVYRDHYQPLCWCLIHCCQTLRVQYPNGVCDITANISVWYTEVVLTFPQKYNLDRDDGSNTTG